MRIDKAMIDQIEWGATIVYDRTMKTARKSNLRDNKNTLQPDTTPGVAILQSALVYTRDQQKLNQLHFDRLEDLVLLDLLESQSDVDDIYKTLNELSSSPKYGRLIYNLRGVHAHYLIFFEFCIWSLLIIGGAIAIKKDDLFTGVNSEPHLKFFDDWDKDVDLTNYLLRRHHQWRDEYIRKEKQGKEAFRRWAGNATLELLDTLQAIYKNSNRVQRELGRYVRHAPKS